MVQDVSNRRITSDIAHQKFQTKSVNPGPYAGTVSLVEFMNEVVELQKSKEPKVVAFRKNISEMINQTQQD